MWKAEVRKIKALSKFRYAAGGCMHITSWATSRQRRGNIGAVRRSPCLPCSLFPAVASDRPVPISQIRGSCLPLAPIRGFYGQHKSQHPPCVTNRSTASRLRWVAVLPVCSFPSEAWVTGRSSGLLGPGTLTAFGEVCDGLWASSQ